MPIEIDIELCCNNQQEQTIDRLSKSLPKNYIVVVRGKTESNTYITFENCVNKVWNLDEAITSFLMGLISLRERIIQFNGAIRVGLFYEVSETVVCPVLLKKETINLIHQFDLSLDITGYPCGNS